MSASNLSLCIAQLTVILAALGSTVLAADTSVLGERRWIHGASDCAVNADPAVDVYAHDQTTYIL